MRQREKDRGEREKRRRDELAAKQKGSIPQSLREQPAMRRREEARVALEKKRRDVAAKQKEVYHNLYENNQQ